jgi:ribonuclease M5
MLKIDIPVVVEGKYDKIKLSNLLDTVIIATNGFEIYKNKAKISLLKFYAEKTGIIILTDSDAAGLRIRNFIKSIILENRLINMYIPDVFGREKRKNVPSKEGKLGVEGISDNVLIDLFKKYESVKKDNIGLKKYTKSNLYDMGLFGRENSRTLRKEFLSKHNLPENLSANELLELMNYEILN